MRSGCSACSRSRSGCRSLRWRPTTRCCRPGSSAPAIPNGPDPYFLYASSNIGSFLALLSYPVLLEPMFTLRTQNLIWTGGYGLLIVLIAACGVLLLRSPVMAGAIMPAEEADAPAPPWTLARALDISRRGAVGPADRGDRAYLHRRRRGAAAVGAAAVALSVDLGAGVPVAPAAAAQMDAAAAAAGDSGRGRSAARSAANRTC